MRSVSAQLVAVACVVLAILPSPAPAQRLLQPSYETASAPRLLEPSYVAPPTLEALDAAPAASEYSKLKIKKASEDWELTGKRRRQQQQAHAKAYSQPEQAYAESSPAYTKAYSKSVSQKSQPDQEYAPTDTHLEPESAASHHASSSSWGGADESAHDGSRIQFHVSGHKGPKSYRFGYDTGKGPHRQFRYEERDGHGMVHGRYGYHDKHGHLVVYHYSAHPHHGYHASKADSGHY